MELDIQHGKAETYQEYEPRVLRIIINNLDLKRGDQYRIINLYAVHVLGLDPSKDGYWRANAGARLNGVGSELMPRNSREFWTKVREELPSVLNDEEFEELTDKWQFQNEHIGLSLVKIFDHELAIEIHANK